MPDSEDVGPLTTNNAANQLPAVPGSAHDFLDGHAFADEPTNDSVCLFTSQISLVLQALGGSQKLRIYACCADCRADLPHRLAHSVEKGVASVLHQMPAVGDLIGMWQGLCGGLRISAAAVSCDDLDLGLLDQALAVAGSRSGSKTIAFRRSRSQMIVRCR